MRIRPFARGIASLVFALFALFAAAPLTAMAVSVCPSGAVCIDESIEGQPPTVTSDSPFFISGTVSPPGPGQPSGPEVWQIRVRMSGAFVAFGRPGTFELLEPDTGTISDILAELGFTPFATSIEFVYLLASDDESGNIVNVDQAGFCPTTDQCGTAVEDGTFQLAQTGQATTAGSFDLYLKSDLEAVPEGPTLILVLTGALTTLTPWARRAFRLRQRPLSQ